MKYILGKSVLGNPLEIEIDEETYSSYKEAKDVLYNCLAIEEKYEILISNYLDLERQIFDIASSNMVRSNSDYADFFDIRLTLNRRLVNLLTAARLYIDQLHGHVKACLPNRNDTKSVVKSLCSAEYDSNPGYRFMEALRNYVQHEGMPVHFTSSSTHWTDMREDGLGENSLLEYSIKFEATKAVLGADKDFKQKVLNEIPDKIDLKIAARRYIESLSNIHDNIRQLIAESVAQSHQIIANAQHQYKGEFKFLDAYKIDDERIIETVTFSLDWDNIRLRLQKKNPKLINFHRRYATSK